VNKTLVLLAIVAAFGLAACDSGPTQEERDAAEKARTDADKAAKQADVAAALAADCRRQLGGFLNALRNTNSRLGVGMSFDDYGDQVGQISIAYDRIPFGQLDLECTMGVGVKAEAAFNSYTKAYNAWNECIGDLYCEMDTVDPELQEHWSKAGRQVRKARSALADLDARANQARAEADEKEKKATEAESVVSE